MRFLPGDVVFIMHHDNWLSKIIAAFMGSKWSHSALVLESTDTETYLLETSDFEVKAGLLSSYLSDPNCELEVLSPHNVSLETRMSAIMSTKKRLYGRLYAYFKLLWAGMRRLLMRVGIRIPMLKVGDNPICLTVPLTAESRFPIPGLFQIDPKSIDTEEFYEIIKQSGAYETRLYKEVGKVL